MGRLLTPFILLVLACASLFYLPLGMRDLWDAEFILAPDHSPLIYQLTTHTMRFFGTSPFAVRFWCATFGLLAIGMTYVWGKNWKNERVGLLAGGILATSAGFFAYTQTLSPATAATFWTTLTLMAGSALLVERSVSRARHLTYIAAIGITGGLLTQGVAALLLPLAALGAAYQGQGRRIPVVKRPWKAAAGLSVLFLLFGWLVLGWRPSSLLSSSSDAIARPVYFFAPIVLAGFFPWVIFLPRMANTWLGHHYAAFQRDAEGAVMVAWIGLVFVFYSVFPSKLAGDILPILPALALLLASEVDVALETTDPPGAESLPSWMGLGVATLIVLLLTVLLILKLPLQVLSVASPAWRALFEQSGLLALTVGLGIFILVGVWGMRQTLVCVGGVMLVQVLLLTCVASLVPEADPYLSSRLLATRFLTRAAPEDHLAVYAFPPETFPHTLAFYTGRPVTEVDSVESLPAAGFVVTDISHWQELRQTHPDTYQFITQTGEKVLLKKQS